MNHVKGLIEVFVLFWQKNILVLMQLWFYFIFIFLIICINLGVRERICA